MKVENLFVPPPLIPQDLLWGVAIYMSVTGQIEGFQCVLVGPWALHEFPLEHLLELHHAQTAQQFRPRF